MKQDQLKLKSKQHSKKMKKCKFCEHHACNERDEEVCVKHLVYVGDDVEAGASCNDFTVNASMVPGIIFLVVSVGLLFLLTSLI